MVPVPRLSLRQRVSLLIGRRPADPLIGAAGELDVSLLYYDKSKMAAQLRALDIDVIAVATFPHILAPALLSAARVGGVNVHQSLLPRLRGPDPLFWTYYDNERESGSTVHWLDAGADTGDIIVQESVPVARGQSIIDLYYHLAERGGRQMADALEAIAAGTAQRRPQDPALATSRPAPRSVPMRVPFDEWSAERTWHFISGTAQLFGPLYLDPAGARMPLRGARGFSIEKHGREPGSYETGAGGLRLFCPDGVVDVDVMR